MTALSNAKKIVQVDGPEWLRDCPIADDAIIYHGAMVGKDGSGYWVPADTSHAALGVADLQTRDDLAATTQGQAFGSSGLPGTFGAKIDNTNGGNGARTMLVRRGTFKMTNKSGDLLDETDIGDTAYVEDDATVRATGGGTVAAGTVVGLDADGGVFVQIPAGSYAQAI